MDHSKCSSLFDASKALLKRSGLIRWDGGTFVAKYPGKIDCEFEKYAKEKFGPDYGRYICWVLFSVGAENLAKAACVCNGVVKERTRPLGYRPYEQSIELVGWVNEVLSVDKGVTYSPQAQEYSYGTLGKYWKTHLDSLCKKRKVACNDRKLLVASYKYLTEAIRNRDTHTYIANKRRKDYPAVEPIFVPAFSILVDTMKAKGHFKEPHHA